MPLWKLIENSTGDRLMEGPWEQRVAVQEGEWEVDPDGRTRLQGMKGRGQLSPCGPGQNGTKRFLRSQANWGKQSSNLSDF